MKNLKTSLSEELEALAYIIYQMIEGDDVLDEANEKLLKHGFVDENGEWIYGEDE
jgi:hypothetical protein